MTPAELRTVRESLNQTIQDVANGGGVKQRTAAYWEAGGRSVPDDVERALNLLDRAVEKMCRDFIHTIEGLKVRPETVILIRYTSDRDFERYDPTAFSCLRLVKVHGAMIARLRLRLQHLGIKVRIVNMDQDAYDAWLGDRENLPDAIGEWAETQI